MITVRELTLFLGFLLAGMRNFNCAPVNEFRHESGKGLPGNFNSDKLIAFMQTYGYLEQPADTNEGLKAEFLYAESAIIDGIKKIQEYGGLKVTGVVDEETIKLMSAPRCGVKDVENKKDRAKRYVIGSKNWKKRKITYFIANFSPKISENKTVEVVTKAFSAWSLYSRLIFKRVYDPSADIIIAFGSYYHGDRYPFDGSGNILAHAFYPYEENAYGGDIHFDADEHWKENSTNLNEGVDFLTVAVHELGHSLGLAHSPVYNAIMFPYYKGLTPAQLDYDDILGLYQLYIQTTLEDNTDPEDVPEVVTSSTATNTSDKDKDKETTTDADQETEEVEVITEAVVEESSSEENISDFCDGSYDSMGTIKDDLYVIKSNYIWKFDSTFYLADGYPTKINKIFPNLPRRFKKIDAFYEERENDEIVFFSGNEYITYDKRGPIYMPYNLTRYTYDPEIEKVNAAMIWKNGKTYLFSDDRFWRYSEVRKMDNFYPRVMKKWNLPQNITGAISFPTKGPTVFFKRDEYFLLDNKKVKPVDGYPKKISNLFSICDDS